MRSKPRSESWNNLPLSDEEIRELLTATLHGPLPTKTMWRLFATLATVPDMRRRIEELEASRAR